MWAEWQKRAQSWDEYWEGEGGTGWSGQFSIYNTIYMSVLYHRLYSLQATVMSIRMISAYFQKLLSIHCKSNLANVRDLNTPFKNM